MNGEWFQRYHFLHSGGFVGVDWQENRISGYRNAAFACYHCIVIPSNINPTTTSAEIQQFRRAYYTAIARERSIQRQTIGIEAWRPPAPPPIDPESIEPPEW